MSVLYPNLNIPIPPAERRSVCIHGAPGQTIGTLKNGWIIVALEDGSLVVATPDDLAIESQSSLRKKLVEGWCGDLVNTREVVLENTDDNPAGAASLLCMEMSRLLARVLDATADWSSPRQECD